MRLRHWSLIIASGILVGSLIGCSSEDKTTATKKTTTAEKHVPTAKVEIKGVSVFTNDTTYTGDEKIIVTLTNNAKTTGTFSVSCEPTDESKVYTYILHDEAGGYSYELKPGQKQKIVFSSDRSFQKGKYHVRVTTAGRHESPLDVEHLISKEINLK
ncbi:hypothetical protein [Bacillus salipaludis]|uniref:hypothetical protein n=1 Tax=Bacillus salipaludis TaxID=2547811 RepID=UPI002E218CA6|nr:hypothetical protein [Bacillus salipaludis]